MSPSDRRTDEVSEALVANKTNQAAAKVPGAADLLAASDFAPHLLNDMHAPVITVILEERLAPGRVLTRVPYL